MSLEDLTLSGEVDGEAFKAALPDLRTELLDLQERLQSAPFSVVLLIEGDDRIGVNELLHRLHEWLDVRRIRVSAYDQPLDQARERPFYWRYWRDLPAHGRIGIVINGWGLRSGSDRLRGRIGSKHFARRLASARDFEQQLVDDGTLLIKVWLHLGRKEARRKLDRNDDEAEGQWRLEDEDRFILENYGKAMRVSRRIVEETATPEPWVVVDGACERFRDLTVGRVLRDRLEARLDHTEASEAPSAVVPSGVAMGSRLAELDLEQALDSKSYGRRMEKAQRSLARLINKLRKQERSLVLVFEGEDSAGKGGSIRRLAAAMDARDYRAHSIAAPTEEERAHHYLWRFWNRLPGAGKVAIFDRSWYGRVLVERVEGFAAEIEWRRAYDEISSFERQLVDHGGIVIKFWLHIDADEQMRRFAAREETPWKRYKITEEDYRNRRRWDEYVLAAEEMFARTDSPDAPWIVVAANDKRHARVQVLESVVDRLRGALRKSPPPR